MIAKILPHFLITPRHGLTLLPDPTTAALRLASRLNGRKITNPDLAALLFQDAAIYALAPACSLVSAFLHSRKMQSETPDSGGSSTGISYRLGTDSHWAELFLMCAATSSAFCTVLVSLEQLGLSDPARAADYRVSDVLESAQRRGLKLCPRGIAPTMLLSGYTLPAHSSIVLMTEPISCSDVGGPRYWCLNGRDDRTYLETAIADPTVRLCEMGGTVSHFGSAASGPSIPQADKFCFMFALPAMAYEKNLPGRRPPALIHCIARDDDREKLPLGMRTDVLVVPRQIPPVSAAV